MAVGERSSRSATGRMSPERRKLWIMLGALGAIAAVCVATIALMMVRLEEKSASFHPPMTAAEREHLLTPEPNMDIAPRVSDLRYGADVGSNQNASNPTQPSEPSQHLDSENTFIPAQPVHVTGATRHASSLSRAQ